MPGPSRLATAAVSIVLLVVLAACGGTGADSAPGSAKPLTIGMSAAPTSMNPALGLAAAYAYFSYDPLIYQTADGRFLPDLAVEWGYIDTTSEVFRLTLRDGVTFSDGSPLNSSAVTASLQYFLKAAGPNIGYAGPVASVEATDDRTVTIRYSEPYPDAVRSLTQDSAFGQIIGPKGLADPQSLETTSDGVGQYTLDPAQTISGTQYTFVPNGAYFNQRAVKFGKIVVKPALAGDAAAAAVQSGQIQYAQSVPAGNAKTLQSAGFAISKGAGSWTGLILADRASAPLDNQKVRQAINHAIDRQPLIDAVYSGYAEPKYQIAVKGDLGYDEALNLTDAYDPQLARQMLAEAGYPAGFSMTMMTGSVTDPNSLLAQAVASQLEAVGVHVDLTTVSAANFSALSDAILSRRYRGLIVKTSANGTYYQMTTILSTTSIYNPFGSVDADADRLLAAASAETDSAKQAQLFGQLNERVTDLAWIVPIAVSYSLQAISPELVNVPDSFVTVGVNPVAPDDSLSWSYAT